MSKPHFRSEKVLAARGVWPVAGVDEAGRGPLAGPVVAAAVVLDPSRLPGGIDDSKKLSAARRDAGYEAILEQALSIAIGIASVTEIDQMNIRQATLTAMRRAIAGLSPGPQHVLIDGNALPARLPCDAQTMVKGDAISLSIAAASIVAKVTRDRLMILLDEEFPAYGFSGHMGYGTPAHLNALLRHGPCPHHRRGFAPVRAALEALPQNA